MTAQLPLPFAPAGAVEIGLAAALVMDDDGGRVFLHGELVSAWDGADEAGRRYAAVQLVRTRAATAVDVAAGFGIDRETLRRWVKTADDAGVVGLVPDKRGPKGPSRVTGDVVAQIRTRRQGGASLRAIAAAVGVCAGSVRWALAPAVHKVAQDQGADQTLAIMTECGHLIWPRWRDCSARMLAPPRFRSSLSVVDRGVGRDAVTGGAVRADQGGSAG